MLTKLRDSEGDAMIQAGAAGGHGHGSKALGTTGLVNFSFYQWGF